MHFISYVSSKNITLRKFKKRKTISSKKKYFKYNKQLQPISLVYFLKYALGTKKITKIFQERSKKNTNLKVV